MIRILPDVIEPDTWFLAFHRTTNRWWVRMLARGTYKHVSAFAWVPELGVWVVFNVTYDGTRLQFIHDNKVLADRTVGADLMRMRRRPASRIARFLALFSCVSAIRHLVGIPGSALPRPDRLWADCLKYGGEPLGRRETSTPVDQPGDPAAAEASRGGSHLRDPGPAFG